MLQLTSRRFLRELDKAPEGNNLQYILKCPCIPFFGNQGLHNEIMLGGNGGRSGVMCEGSPYTGATSLLWIVAGRGQLQRQNPNCQPQCGRVLSPGAMPRPEQ